MFGLLGNCSLINFELINVKVRDSGDKKQAAGRVGFSSKCHIQMKVFIFKENSSWKYLNFELNV
jgi:hypothetical protein